MFRFQILLMVVCCAFAAMAADENVVTTDDGGLKVGPRPKPKPTPAEKVLVPKRNDNSGAFGTKPKGPVEIKPTEPVVQKPTPAATPVPHSDVLSSGEATLKATYVFDFEQGKTASDGDLFYNHRDDVVRFLRPRNGATIALLQRTDFRKTDADRLKAVSYSDRPIDASDNADNELRRGVVIAIKTRSGHFAKMRVTSYGRDLGFEWVTYR